MLKIFKLFISFVFFGICIGLPIKDQEIDELIYRLQELKHQSRYNGAHAVGTEINQNSHSKSTTHPTVDLERKPLLYDYYPNAFNNADKRFDEIDRLGMVGLQGKRNFDEIDRSAFSGFHGKRNFDEIDRSGLSGFHGKRNFDEIDRSGLNGFHKKRSVDNMDDSTVGDLLSRYYSDDNEMVKRNFDEIDRFGPGGFLKRNFQRELDEISRLGRGSQFTKKNFDEIDRFGFTGLKRSAKLPVPKSNN
ncbi:orcokinin peptides type B-like isoform X1 [Bradysia coprophila]|uniref:orcokinin peptides type B-like isoform X1 n=1 Tax=Bradysia coprophila TaxID=38358 RepID=UPI00187D8C5E|nr:orcokinin peptides type B-like isoform X1 [Bradysia coprophila]